MSQTSYANTFSGLSSGSVADTGPARKGTWVNGEGADIPAGIFVAFKSESGQYKSAELPDSEDARIVGIVINSFARNPNDLSGINAVKDGAVMNVMEEGAVMMATEQTIGPADPVYCRVTSDGASNTQLGKLRKDSDSGKAILVPGARVLFGGTTSQAANVYFSAAVNLSSTGFAQSEIADLTDNSGGASADGTIGAVTAPTALTDNSGGASADGTIGAVTAPTALTDNGGGTADGTVQAMTDPADTPATADALRDDLVANFTSGVRNNFKELTTTQTANRTAIVALTDAVKELSTAQGQDRTAIVALTDAVKELSTKTNLILAALRTAGILQS